MAATLAPRRRPRSFCDDFFIVLSLAGTKSSATQKKQINHSRCPTSSSSSSSSSHVSSEHFISVDPGRHTGCNRRAAQGSKEISRPQRTPQSMVVQQTQHKHTHTRAQIDTAHSRARQAVPAKGLPACLVDGVTTAARQSQSAVCAK